MSTLRQIKIFVATPKDVAEERERLERLVERVNSELSAPLGIVLRRIGWGADVGPGMGRAQSHLTRRVDDCDVFIGVLWHRFGTPPGVDEAGRSYESGTEEEFERALFRWIANGSQDVSAPHIMMFFSDRKASPSSIDPQQMEKVRQFRRRFEPGGEHPGLYEAFASIEDFDDRLHRHLVATAFALAGGSAVAQVVPAEVIGDFVDLAPEIWHAMFSTSQSCSLLLMYGRTWRNTYRQGLRDLLRRGGTLRVILPAMRSGPTSMLAAMAERLSISSTVLLSRVEEAHREFLDLVRGTSGAVEVRFTLLYLTHALYLFDSAGLIALYSYTKERVPTTAVRLASGQVLRQSHLEFQSVWEQSHI